MDSLLQMSRDRSDRMHLFIEDQVRRIDNAEIDRLMRSEMFSIENLEIYNYEVEADTEQMRKLCEYQAKLQEYNRELHELERGKDTPDGAIDYYCKLIEAEQNTMNMRIMKAAVLGRGGVAKRVRAESLAKIISYRQVILEYCAGQSILGLLQQKELELETAEYGRAMDELNLEVLITAALDRVKEEREAAESRGAEEAGMIREFFNTDFSEQVLHADYVIQNLDSCMHNVELIRRIEKMSIERREDMNPDEYTFVTRKLEAVKEYINVVESVLWKYGMMIDYAALQVRKIDENDGAFAARRQAYQNGGALRFGLGARKYRHAGEKTVPDGQHMASVPTKIEEKLSVLEATLEIQGREDDMKIMSHTRIVGRSDQVNPGEVIRASNEEAQGRMDDRLIKLRISSIYQSMAEKIAKQFPNDKKEFQILEETLANYVCTNRKTYEKRSDVEKREKAALEALRAALMEMREKGENLCAVYADLLLGLITEESSGYLDVTPDQVDLVEDQSINLSKKGHPITSWIRTYIDCTGTPLFIHRPNIKDIEQGGLGDCYLLAGLVSLVEQNAEEIMNIMKDNGDGTVTVRFMQGETDGSGNLSYTPYFVRVRKTVPVYRMSENDSYSRGAFWVKMMEKAYAASGFHILERTNEERQRRGESSLTARELESSIAQGEQRVDYNDIEGGMTGPFLGLLLGKESEKQYLDKNKADAGADRIGRLLPPVNEPEWDQDPARRYGNDSADSIVYEYIKKVFEPLADTFLHLKKPAGDSPDQEEYERQRKSMQFLIRPCMCQLDIIATIMRETNTDILGMKSEREIQKWYEELGQMFVHYKSAVDSHSKYLNKKDKIIAGVRKNYWREEIPTFFDTISAVDFQVTLDILKERHLALFRRNRHTEQGAGGGESAQLQRGYYTYRDYKLYERIKERLGAGAYVAFGTRKLSEKRTGMNGESEAGGMVGEHAYSIINTCSKIIGGEERLFFVIMNPWATKGVVYDVGVDGLKERAVRGQGDDEKEEGVFLLDVKRFAEIVSHWDSVPA